MKISFKKKIAAAAAAATIVGGAGAALAFWTTTGTGSGTAATTAGVADDLDITSASLTPMYPGDLEQDLVVTVENTNATESAYVTTVKAYLTVSGVCNASDFLLNGNPAPGTALTAAVLGWTAQDLAASDSDVTSGDTIQFNNKASNQDGCKSAAVTLHYLAS